MPSILRLYRASTQYEVKEAVKRNLEMLKRNDKDGHPRHRLVQIMNAIEHPYDVPEIPQR
ncbi:hypothetical protein KHS38_14025 [Mucilaginibacter sp. Bleaf8]|uniref:hypothetical protein n=1 Tax=Mucilaginibacter sp. Bleaf8 TaxID=2834430 RepID=UPI001BD0A760|nr:hypothetical protein [Mucilaginibacter sp. Bleaf8]MBS7565526.1 hypothetical protein [Mucilaginibacter sp. Bleaf8]